MTYWRTKVRANLIAANFAARTMRILNACTYLDVRPCAVIETGVRGQTRFHSERLEKRTRRFFLFNGIDRRQIIYVITISGLPQLLFVKDIV